MSNSEHYPFELEPLPYDYGALEPYIDEQTMHLHHDRHLKTYVDNLNNALKDYPEYQTWPLKRLLQYIGWLPESIRTTVKNNAGGVYNHELYFESMAPAGQTSLSGSLEKKIEEDFGSFDAFKERFKSAALSVFGSGYAWLALTQERDLTIRTTANQDTLVPLDLHPIFLIDVWEHAYYLKHYNVRADYIDDWFNVINFDMALKRFESFEVKEWGGAF